MKGCQSKQEVNDLKKGIINEIPKIHLAHLKQRFSSFFNLSKKRKSKFTKKKNVIAQSAGAEEYTDCTSAEGYDSPHPQQVSWIWQPTKINMP